MKNVTIEHNRLEKCDLSQEKLIVCRAFTSPVELINMVRKKLPKKSTILMMISKDQETSIQGFKTEYIPSSAEEILEKKERVFKNNNLKKTDIVYKLITLVVANQKGGVGKTTTALNLAASLSAASRKVLLIDLDSQKNASSASGVDNITSKLSLLDALVDDKPINSLILKTDYKFDIIPASQDLISAEMELMNANNPTSILKEKLSVIKNKYDYLVIDCPPSLGMLSVSALRAADKVLIPLQCEYYSGRACSNESNN